MRLELSRAAQADLDAIRDFSLTKFGVAPTIAYLDAIEAAFRRLLDFPEIGMIDPILPPRLRSLPCGQHRIFYRIEDEEILIVRLLHQTMDAERHLDS